MSPQEIQRTLRQLGLRPQTAAGQNFLWDEEIVERMVEAADIAAGETVLEIGPGLGILTEALLNRGAEVIAVEIDKRLTGFLKKKFSDHPGFKLVEGDIFRVRLDQLFADGDYKLVANLPYSATSLVFRNFLTLPPRPTSMTVMVQRDVADRLSAPVGELSILAVMAQQYSTVTKLFDVDPDNFFPVPKVWSSVIQCTNLQPVSKEDDKRFMRVVRAGFSARRKQLQNSLAGSLHKKPLELAKILEDIGLSPTIRAQDVPVEKWSQIVQKVS